MERAGMDYTALAIACEEISAGDGSTLPIVMVDEPRRNICSATERRAEKEFLKPIAQGKSSRVSA
jgi:alkylation response protein AidB-like acyl-CoA dehydrogenase